MRFKSAILQSCDLAIFYLTSYYVSLDDIISNMPKTKRKAAIATVVSPVAEFRKQFNNGKKQATLTQMYHDSDASVLKLLVFCHSLTVFEILQQG